MILQGTRTGRITYPNPTILEMTKWPKTKAYDHYHFRGDVLLTHLHANGMGDLWDIGQDGDMVLSLAESEVYLRMRITPKNNPIDSKFWSPQESPELISYYRTLVLLQS